MLTMGLGNRSWISESVISVIVHSFNILKKLFSVFFIIINEDFNPIHIKIIKYYILDFHFSSAAFDFCCFVSEYFLYVIFVNITPHPNVHVKVSNQQATITGVFNLEEVNEYAVYDRYWNLISFANLETTLWSKTLETNKNEMKSF